MYFLLKVVVGCMCVVLELLEGCDLVVFDGLDVVVGYCDDEVVLFDFYNCVCSVGIMLLYIV